MDLLDRAAFALGPAAAGGDHERLAERMSVPRGARAGLEGDRGALDDGGLGRLEERVDADGAGEPVGWTLGGWLRADAFDFHDVLLAAILFCVGNGRRIADLDG